MKNNFISVLVTNYNKSKFLKKSLSSLSNQTYKNFEIILFDDCSNDNSIKIIKKFKKVKLIKNKFKISESGPLNQINGLINTFKKSKGKIICLMDSDDYFAKNKLMEINDYFNLNKKHSIAYNLPTTSKDIQFLIKKKLNYQIWPTIFPTSCIFLRRNAFKKFKENIFENKYDKLEIDARICIFFKFFFNEYNILKKNLTVYNNDPNGITSNIPKFSRIWWIRRRQAFDYLKFLLKKKKVKFEFNFDYYFTSLISFILQKVF